MIKRTFLPPEPRRLKLNFLHYPKTYAGPQSEWELHRGFRIRVLSRNCLALFIGQPPSDSTLLSRCPEEGEDSFLLLPAPSGVDPKDLEQGFQIANEEGWSPQVSMILSDGRRLQGSTRKTKAALRKAIPKAHPGLVLWVWQEMPGELCQGMDFFNSEQILHQLGRMGRRVSRRAKWRRFLP